MKKIMAIAAIALMTMACSKVENLVESQATIGFSAEVGKSTKAPISGTTFGTGLTFGVFSASNGGQTVMSNVEIAYATDAWRAKGDTKYYWPNDANTTLDFHAYFPFTSTAPTFSKENGITFTSYVNDFVTDLMYGTPAKDLTYKTCPATGVPVVFNHALTQILFTIKATPTPGVTFTVTSLKLVDIPSTATFTVNNTTWGAASAPAPFSVFSGTQVVTETKAQIGDVNALVIPQDATALTFEIIYKVEGNNVANETVTKTLEFGNVWSRNQKISYNLTVGMNEITFNPSIIEWVDEDAAVSVQ